MATASSLKDDLIAQGLQLRETHISLVFLAEDRVYKVKKPVALGFLDFSTLERRRSACEAELRLNRRLAPRIYLRVVPISLDLQGRHRIDGEGEPVEWAVEMVRLRDEDTAQAKLEAGELSEATLQQLAQRLAEFHRTCRSDGETAVYGRVGIIEGNILENFQQTRDTAPQHIAAADVAEIEGWQLGFLRDHEALFETRAAQGRVRDGHGDLRLEHVYLGEHGVEIIDCIEFNDRFRYADVCADLAFLSMDLAYHGRVDLSERLIAAYARESQDYDVYGLVDFYESYRAYVRGKVASFLEEDPGVDAALRARAHGEARKYYQLAQAMGRESLERPALYAVGGLIASGKSTVADALCARRPMAAVDSDRTRKYLSGVAAETPLGGTPFGGAYTLEMSERVYEELRRRADLVLASGRPVVVEASFRSRDQRMALRQLALAHDVPFLMVECRAEPQELRRRLAQRAQGASVSDGRGEILQDFMDRYEPVDELADFEHVVLDTELPLEANLDRIRARG